ncbi:MAG: hydrogenase iron-sulfur subunit [Thermodesulfobacteriota bacterium]
MAAPANDFQPQITVLYCRQCLSADAQPFEGRRPGQGFAAQLVLLPCSSKMQVHNLMRILEKGVDGVQMVACPEESCQHLVGSLRAEKRLNRAQDLLRQAGLASERLGLHRGQGLSLESVLELASQRAEAVRPLGPNPLKGVNR